MRIDIPGYEGLYQADSNGYIFSLIKDSKMNPGTDSYGYHHVSLYIDKKKTTKKVHRLIMLSFRGPSKLEVNHKDGNKQNNKLSNLEYVTSSQNQRHAFKTGLQNASKGDECSWSKLTEKEVVEIKNLIKEGQTQRSIAKQFDVHFGTINMIALGKNWRHVK